MKKLPPGLDALPDREPATCAVFCRFTGAISAWAVFYQKRSPITTMIIGKLCITSEKWFASGEAIFSKVSMADFL
jgi:hypothetical protein